MSLVSIDADALEDLLEFYRSNGMTRPSADSYNAAVRALATDKTRLYATTPLVSTPSTYVPRH